MPIRTRRGRASAYRALWAWPLHSPARFFACVVVVAAVIIGVGALTEAVSGPDTPRTSGRSGPTGEGQTGTGPALAPAPLTPRTLPISAAPPAALAAAERWVQAWATHPPGMTPAQWAAGLRPYTTAEYLGVLATVDPANVPGTRTTGPAQAVEVRPKSMRIQVPTDAVRLELLLVQVAPGDWRVTGYDRAR